MSTEKAEATRYRCDNGPCGITRLSDSGVPAGWFEVTFAGHVSHFHERECVAQAVRLAPVTQRDTSFGGWIATSLVPDADPYP